MEDLTLLLKQQCNQVPCETYTTSAGPWSDCSQPCGGAGVRTRTIQCFSSAGYAASWSHCSDKPAASETCNPQVRAPGVCSVRR